MRTSFFIFSSLLLQACIIVESGKGTSSSGDYDIVVDGNDAPFINYANSGCYYDSSYMEDIWYFEADVEDPDSVLDVDAVFVDIYDVWTNELDDTFALDPTEDLSFWFVEWFEYSTNLDCYYDGYEVDVVAYDTLDEYDIITIVPETY